VPDTPRQRRLAEALADEFGVEDEDMEVLFATEATRTASSRPNELALVHLARAVLQAPTREIPGFSEANRRGLLPADPIELRARWGEDLVTDAVLVQAARSEFAPHQVPQSARKYAEELLRRLDVADKSLQGRCLRTLLAVGRKHKTHNPAHARCLGLFTAALLQGEISGVSEAEATRLLPRLRPFGLSRLRMRECAELRFTSHALKATPGMRQQIRDMAGALGFPAEPFLKLLLESG